VQAVGGQERAVCVGALARASHFTQLGAYFEVFAELEAVAVQIKEFKCVPVCKEALSARIGR
jgi:hypothetical protein